MKRFQISNPDTMIRIGLIFLIIGLLSLRYLNPAAALQADIADGAAGVFMGIAIGSMLSGIRIKGRLKRAEGANGCE